MPVMLEPLFLRNTFLILVLKFLSETFDGLISTLDPVCVWYDFILNPRKSNPASICFILVLSGASFNPRSSRYGLINSYTRSGSDFVHTIVQQSHQHIVLLHIVKCYDMNHLYPVCM